MNQYRILTLTDHSGHSDQNSVYSLLRAMSTNKRCLQVDIASRGNKNNDPFFRDLKFDKLYAIEVKDNFHFEESGDQFIDETKAVNPQDYDIIFLRLPPPLTNKFLNGLQRFLTDKVIVNNPKGIIKCSNKAFLLDFQDLCPPIRLCRTINEVLEFTAIRDIVLKPLQEYGGTGLLKITGDILNDGDRDWDTKSYLKKIENKLKNKGYLAMKYLKNVNLGDKRLLVVNGEIMAASLRLPAQDSWLCNVSKGGTSVAAEPTQKEKAIVEKIAPHLRDHGILIYGVDTLVDDEGSRTLSEINANSIGGFSQAEIQTGIPIIKKTINKIFEYADAQYGF